GPAPAVSVTHQNRTQETVSVHGQGQGFWLVLGESLSRGWQASIRPASGGPAHSLGAPTLIDGYANGWYVPASLAGPDMVAQIDWAPQKVVWVALAASALGLLVCAALALLPLRRRGAGLLAQENIPVLGSALAFGGARPGRLVALAWALGAGVVAGVLTGPLAAPVVAGLVLLGLMLPYGRLLLGGAAVGMVLATAGYMIDAQWYHRYLSNIDWPGNFPVANTLGWAAVILLAADGLVEFLRHRAGMDQPA
ncbi:MAG: hypothetical protein ACYCTI_14105, partial [Acidimicrobiales bacterium]